MNKKTAERARYRALRAAIDETSRQRAQERITDQVLKILSPDRRVLLYVGVRKELPTMELIASLLARGQALAVPRIQGDRLIPARLTHIEDLLSGRFGVPTSPKEALPSVDTCLTPGVAFTGDGDRLGQGGGYYDRFFAEHPNLWRVGLAFDQQMADALPLEPHDQAVHTVITPTAIWGSPSPP